MSTPIPEIRECLHALARRCIMHSDQDVQDIGLMLRYLAEETRRRPAVTRAPPSSAPVTEETRRMVIAIHSASPDMRMDQIAAMFNMSQGRVSEILHP